MQSHVAELLRQGKGELLGETDSEKDISERLLQLGFAEDVVREQAKRLPRARELRAAANRKRNPSLADEHEEDTGGSVGHLDSGDEDEMLEQSEDEVQTWRVGLHEEGRASDKELNVQDTEHAEEILGRNTNTRHAEEAVDLVASSSSQCAEGSKELVAKPVSCTENVLTK